MEFDDAHGLVVAIRRLVRDIAEGRLDEVERDGRAGRCTAADLKCVIAEYGRTLLPLPDEAFEFGHVHEYENDPDGCFVDVDLWTSEEGRSDLTLSLEARKEADGYRVEISDLHVL